MIWLLRLAALVAAVLLLRWLWSWFWSSGWKRLLVYATGKMERPPLPSAHHGSVQRDPVCGTYVDVEVAVQGTANGQTFYFCSEDCRDAYRARQQERIDKTG